MVHALVFRDHHFRSEAFLELAPALFARNRIDLADGGDQFVDFLARNPVTPGLMTSGTDPHGRAMTGVPHASASIIARPNGSGQSIVKSNASAPPRNSLFCTSSISPMYSIIGGLMRGLITSVEVLLVDGVDFGRDLERHSRSERDLDRNVDTFFGRYPSDESEILSALSVEAKQVARHAVMHRRDPIHLRQRRALRITDRDQRRFGKSMVHRMKVGDVEASMHRRNGRHFGQLCERERPVVDVRMHDVETVAGRFRKPPPASPTATKIRVQACP